MSVNMPDLESLSVDEIQPYTQNPRRIPEHAIQAVMESLSKYGYHQPIVVDSQYEIIVGHTRFEAMKRLGVTRVQVYVARNLTDEQARQYRLVDNRAGELSDWEHERLVMELREFEQSVLDTFFPDVDLEIEALENVGTTSKDIERGAVKAAQVSQQDETRGLMTQVECPQCLKHFPVSTASLPNLSAADLKALTLSGQE